MILRNYAQHQLLRVFSYGLIYYLFSSDLDLYLIIITMYQQAEDFEAFLRLANKSKVKFPQSQWRDVFFLVRKHGIDSLEFINYARQLPDKFRYPFREFIKKWASQELSGQIYQPLSEYLQDQLQLNNIYQELIWQAFTRRNFQKANQILQESLQTVESKQKLRHSTKLFKIYNLYIENNPETPQNENEKKPIIVAEYENKGLDLSRTTKKFYAIRQKHTQGLQRKRAVQRINLNQSKNINMSSTKIKAAQPDVRPASSRAYHSKMTKQVQQSSQESDNKVIRTPQPKKNFEILPDVTGKKSSSIFESLNSKTLSSKIQQFGKTKMLNDRKNPTSTEISKIQVISKDSIIEKAKKFKNIRVKEFQTQEKITTPNIGAPTEQQVHITPCAYIVQKLKKKKLYGFEQEIEEEDFIKCLQKSPQFYDRYIRDSLGKTGPYAIFLAQLKQDKIFNRMLAKIESYPLHQIYRSITRKSKIGNLSTLYSIDSNILEWQPDTILQQTKKKFVNYISQTIRVSQDNLSLFMSNVIYFFLDVLIRRADLPARVQDINLIAQQALNQALGEISFYDFITLLVKFIDNRTLPYFGHLLHKNKLPIPAITCTLESGIRKYECEMSLLQSILHFRKTKLILNIGTTLTQKKGKTDLISSLFDIGYRRVSSPSCQFHKGCVSFYTNLGSMADSETFAIADLHGNIMDALKEDSVRKLADNANMIILHVDSTEENNLEDIFQRIHIYATTSNSLVIIRDSENQFRIKPEARYRKIYLKHMNHVPETEREIIETQIRETIIQIVGSNKKIINFKSLVPLAYKNILFESEKFQKDILTIMQKEQSSRSLWKTCFPSLMSERQNYQLSTRLYRLQNEIKVDPDDPRHQQYLLNNKEYQERSKRDKSTLSSPLTQIYINNNDKIRLKHLNNRIAEWKIPHVELLEKKLAELRARLQANQGKPEQLRAQIKLLEESLKEFDVSADTLLHEIISNFKNESQEKYRNTINSYYEELSIKMNPINLIDGYTLLFGNKFLSDFFQQISKEVQKDKKVYIVSVIGSQSSAKSTLMNYLFNCEFETSAGRCTKGVYFSIVRSQNQVIVVIDTEGLMSVSARDRVFDIQIACFTFLISDITIINNKGEISAPIRELLSISIHTLEQLDLKSQRKFKKSKLFFAIRDQSGSGVQKQKSMLSDIITFLKANDDLVNCDRFVDFTSQDIYPLESAFIQTPTKMKTSVEKPNYYFSEQILAMRSKILKQLRTKNPQFANLAQFYTQSQRVWEIIKEQNDQIYDFQSIGEVRVKKILREIQAKSIQTELQNVKQLVSEQMSVMSNIFSNAQLSTFKQALMDNFRKGYQGIQLMLQAEVKKMKGVKSQWKKLIMEDSKRLWNSETIKIKEIIYKGYRSRFKKNKFDQVEKSVEILAKTMSTTKCTLQFLRKQFNNYCEILRAKDDQFYYNDNELAVRTLLQNQIWQVAKIPSSEYRQNSWTRNQDRKFTFYFSLSFLKFNASNFITRSQKIKYVDLLEEKLNMLMKSIQALNKKYFPLMGISNESLISEYLSLTNKVIEVLKKDLKLLTKGWKFHTLKVEENNFRFSAFWGLCNVLPRMIIKNRENDKGEQQKNAFIVQKWNQIQKLYQIRGDSSQIAMMLISRFEQSLFQQISSISKTEILKSLETLKMKLNPARIMQELMRLTFKSTEENKQTWIRCFKMIYDVRLFLKEEVIDKQSQIVELQAKIAKQKSHMKNYLVERIDAVKQQIQYVENYEQLFKLLQINSAIFQNLNDPKNFKTLLTHVVQKFNHTNSQSMKDKIMTSLAKEDGIFKKIECEVMDILEKDIVPQIMGCLRTCPRCSMKCRLGLNHVGGHQCLENSHLQECFAGIANPTTGERSQKMCFTYESVGDESSPLIQQIQQQDKQWTNHFKQGPFQDRINELICEKVWSNIGDVLLETKYKNNQVKNANIFQKYCQDPIQFQDIRQWITRQTN